MSDKSSSICILNCVEDAQSFLKEFSDNRHQWILVSIHSSVNDYLRTLNIDCLELASLLTHDFIVAGYKEAIVEVNRLLSFLDNRYGEAISMALDLQKMAFFTPLYSYLGKFEYLAALKMKKALEILFQKHAPLTVMIYQSVETSFFAGDDLLTGVVLLLSQRYGFSVTTRQNKVVNRPIPNDNLLKNIAKAIRSPAKLYRKSKELSLKKLPFRYSPRKKTIWLLEPLYELEFLKVKLPSRFNVVLWPMSGIPKNLSTINAQLDQARLDQIQSLISDEINDDVIWTEAELPILTFLKQNILKDFLAQTVEYLNPLFIFARTHTKYQFDLGIWGNSPAQGTRALIVEYLSTLGIPLLGMQHGGFYGVQNCLSKHFDSDFSRCTHYLTYGFDQNDLKNTYPDEQIPCQIIPVGSVKEHPIKSIQFYRKEKIDILFPLTNGLLISKDTFRIKSDLLTHYQLELLNTLDTFSEMRIMVKPMPNYSDKDCSVVEALKKLEHVKVIENMSLVEWFEKYETRAIVIEFPSTPLFEVIGKDVDIFVMADPILPFSQAALNLLTKRVHYFEAVEDLQQALVEWRNGKLSVLRNDEFYRKYVFRENTPDTILNVIKRCL